MSVRYRILAKCLSLSMLCANVAATQTPSKVQRVGVELILGRVIDGALGADGTLCIADDSDQSVTCLGPDGNKIWKAGHRGEGPGEFRGLYRIAIAPDKSVYALDFAKRSILLFDAHGAYKKSIPLNMGFTQILSFRVPAANTLVIAGKAYNAGQAGDSAVHLFRIADSLEYIRSFGPMPKASEATLAMSGPGSVSVTPTGTYLYSRTFPYELYEYAADGKLIRKVPGKVTLQHGPDDIFVVERSTTRTTYKYKGQEFPERVGAANADPNGRWLIWRTQPDGKRLFDVYDSRAARWAPSMPWASGSVVVVDAKRGRVLMQEECDGEPCLQFWPLPASGK